MSNFKDTIAEMKNHRLIISDEKVYIKIKNPKQVMLEAFDTYSKCTRLKLQWLPEYDEVADWLSDNRGRGLFLHGDCGRGKSILCRFIIPAILLSTYRKVVSVFDVQAMNSNIDLVLSKHIVCLDDIGTEDVSNIYGNKRLAFAEIMDAAEKHDKLLLVSTNLSADEIQYRYGDRILDRIKSTTRRILFEGESLRM